MTFVVVCDPIWVRMPPIGTGAPGERGAPSQETAGGLSEDERAEALGKLKELLDSGVLTKEQYEAERQKILRRK